MAFLGACGGQEAPDNHGWGEHFDVLGVAGMRLRYSPVVAPDSLEASVVAYETVYREVQDCMGVAAPPPFVIVVAANGLAPKLGVYYGEPALVLVDERAAFAMARHEFVHHLLLASTGSVDPEHRSSAWASCSSLVPA